MTKSVKIAAVIVILLAVTGVAAAWLNVTGGERGRAGPEIAAAGYVWKSTLFDGEDDHNQYAIWVNLEAPDDFDLSTMGMDAAMWIDMCQSVVDVGEDLLPAGVAMDDIEHVDLNFLIGKQKALLHDITVYVVAGQCVDRFSFALLDDMDTMFSQHSARQNIGALVHAWGLAAGGMTYSNQNGERSIEVEYQIHSNFQRDPQQLNVLALCVLTLASIEKEVEILFVDIDPARYPEMAISLVSRSGVSFANFTRNYGTATIPLKDGQCEGVAT